MVGWLTNTNVNNVAKYLASNGIQVVAGKARTIEHMQGQRWILKQPARSHTKIPEETNVQTRIDVSVSIRFATHNATPEVDRAVAVDDNDD